MATQSELKKTGRIIRELRLRAGITGATLGNKAGLSQSKISKIETGLYARLKRHEISKILNILNADTTIQQQVLAMVGTNTLAASHHVYNTRISTPFDLELRPDLIRIYMINGVPAVLQTIEYRQSGLRQHFGIDEDDIPAILKITLKRQDLLWDTRRKYHVIMMQSALYSFRKDAATQLAQLDRLERLMGLPNLRIGIIPVEASLPAAETGPFALYDEHTLVKAGIRGDVLSNDESEIDMHVKLFDHLNLIASYDDSAIELLRRAMNHIATR